MLKADILVFVQKKVCIILYLISLLLVNGNIGYVFIYSYLTMGQMTEVNLVFEIALRWQVLLFAAFLIMSFEYMAEDKKSNLKECLESCKVPYGRRQIQKILVLLLGVLSIGLCVFIWHIAACLVLGVHSAEYMLYVVKLLGIYIILLNSLAVLLGALFSYISNFKIAYIICFITIMLTIVMYFSKETITINSLLDFCHIFEIVNYSENYAVFYPVNLHGVTKIAGFLSVVVFFLMLLLLRRKKKWFCVVMIPIFAGCIYGFQLPTSCYYPGYQYDEIEIMEETDDVSIENMAYEPFTITDYNMALRIYHNLEAQVTIQFSKSNLPEYVLTLYSGYEVSKVVDDKQSAVPFKREENFLILSNEDKELSKVTVYYKGNGALKYYAGTQGTYLPGSFPYYPMAGALELYEIGLCELPKELSHYTIAVDSNKTIYCNLGQKEHNQFEGDSNNLTLVSGFYKKKTIDGVTYVYPSVSALFDLQKNSFLYDGIVEFMKEDVPDKVIDYSLQDKLMIIAPYYDVVCHYMYGSDCIVLQSKADLELYYKNYVQTGNWYYSGEVAMPDKVKEKMEEE